MARRGGGEVGVEQRLSGVGERVEDDLAVAPRARQPGRAEVAQVVADEVLGAAGDPGEVADAQLLAVAQGERDQQPRGVAERLRARRRGLGERWIEAGADRFGARQVEAE